MRSKQSPKSYSGSRRNGNTTPSSSPLHRTGEVMRRESITVRSLAGRLNITQGQAARLIDPENDLSLSDLYRLRDVLGVPLEELISEVRVGLSEPIKLRAQLLRLMRTVHSIQDNSNQEQVTRLAGRMRDDLLKIMPELAEVSSWPVVGNRRTAQDLGAIVDRCVSAELFPPLSGDQVD